MARIFGNQARTTDGAAQERKVLADGYINIFAELPDGSDVKLGFCALHKDKQIENQLLGWLEAKEENASKLGTVLKFKYNSGTPKERVALVLPD